MRSAWLDPQGRCGSPAPQNFAPIVVSQTAECTGKLPKIKSPSNQAHRQFLAQSRIFMPWETGNGTQIDPKVKSTGKPPADISTRPSYLSPTGRYICPIRSTTAAERRTAVLSETCDHKAAKLLLTMALGNPDNRLPDAFARDDLAGMLSPSENSRAKIRCTATAGKRPCR